MRCQLVIPATVAFAIATACLAQTPLGSEFTYQGQLKASSLPPLTTADFQFSLFDALNGGTQVGPAQPKDNVALVNGAFTISLDFGAAAFNGEARWLGIAVRSPAGAGGFTTLNPRQSITATPNATYSAQTRGLSVDSNNRVGVGITGPAARLEVKGLGSTSPFSGSPIARFTRGNGANSIDIFGDISGNYIVADDPGENQKDLRLQTRNNRNILLEPSGTGRVGIGTDEPAGAMHLRHSDPRFILQDYSFVGSQIGSIGFLNSSSVQTASVGFATHDNPHFSITNDRPGGDINLLPSSGRVRASGGLRVERTSSGGSFSFADALGRTVFDMGVIVNEDHPKFYMISPITGDIQAGMERSLDDLGHLFAEEKNFRAPNPADAATDIWYCCPEGPEAAMYVRGTGRLVDGRATIELPDHFRNLASEPGMTVQLTPRSLESKGLATSKISLSGIEVGELQSGTGNYEFDWRVEAVRKGHENYQVIRAWLHSDDDPDKAWQNRLKHIEERRAHGKPSPDTNTATPRPQN